MRTNFTYDGLGQLREVTSEQRKLTEYSYDKAGNILSKLGGPHSGQYRYNSVNGQTSPAMDNDLVGQVEKLQGNRLEWDSAGRLRGIDRGNNERTELTYDGLGRRVRITEKKGNKVVSDKRYFWVGGAIVTERDALQPGAPITKRYFAQGVQMNGQALYYCVDHLGSVRELVDSTGKVRVAYHYASYGRRSKVSGDLDSDWGFAGLWHHEASGLDLATYRAYDATRGRWLSRDPLGEAGGLNLLQYCGGDPLNHFDPAGLEPVVSGILIYYNLRNMLHVGQLEPGEFGSTGYAAINGRSQLTIVVDEGLDTAGKLVTISHETVHVAAEVLRVALKSRGTGASEYINEEVLGRLVGLTTDALLNSKSPSLRRALERDLQALQEGLEAFRLRAASNLQSAPGERPELGRRKKLRRICP